MQIFTCFPYTLPLTQNFGNVANARSLLWYSIIVTLQIMSAGCYYAVMGSKLKYVIQMLLPCFSYVGEDEKAILK